MFSIVKIEHLNQLALSVRDPHLSLLIPILGRLVKQFVYWKSPNISLYFEIDDFSSKKYTHTHTHMHTHFYWAFTRRIGDSKNIITLVHNAKQFQEILSSNTPSSQRMRASVAPDSWYCSINI